MRTRTYSKVAEKNVRYVRRVLAQSHREALKLPHLSAEKKRRILAKRATDRRFETAVLSSGGAVILAGSKNGDSDVWGLIKTMKDLLEFTNKPTVLRKLADDHATMRAEISVACRIIRNHARQRNLGKADAKAAIRLAVDIENYYTFDSDSPCASNFLSFVGQKGGRRALFIRSIEMYFPGTIDGRLAAIAELIGLMGYPDTTQQLVRSTLLKGNTSRRPL